MTDPAAGARGCENPPLSLFTPKAKFRDHVRSKNDTAMKNEVLLKFLCHNTVVVHQAIIELGIDGVFWPEKGEARSVMPFCRNQTAATGISG